MSRLTLPTHLRDVTVICLARLCSGEALRGKVEEAVAKIIEIKGKLVLQELLRYSGLSWSLLCRSMGFEPGDEHGDEMALFYCLVGLNKEGLIAVDGVTGSEQIEGFLLRELNGYSEDADRKIRASETWRKIQVALEMPYGDRGTMPGWRGSGVLTVCPSFGEPSHVNDADVFVVSPFDEKFDQVYSNSIKEATVGLGLSVKRADDISSARQIMHDVWSSICGSSVVVADCTERNPNVFYEIGITHTVGRPVVLLTQKAGDIPFDLRSYRNIEYALDEAGLKRLRRLLALTLVETLGLPFDSRDYESPG